MADMQLAIVNKGIKESFVNGKDTVQLHAVQTLKLDNLRGGIYPLKDFSLLDDASIKCTSRVIARYYFELEFNTPVPKENKYEISLYYLDKLGQLKFADILNVENIRQGDKFRLSCDGIFDTERMNSRVMHANDVDDTTIICSKISRIDSLNVLEQKSSLHFSQENDCSRLFENAALSNLTISVENREFKVHKEILAAKSSVFLAMFETEMKEKRENHVEIEDIEANIFQEFLRYIYTNTINNLNTYAEKLYKAADKYDLSNLKLICIDELSKSLNVENAIDILSFADENNETILKEKTMDFIKKQMKIIFKTEGYKALCQSPKAYLIDEILQATFDHISTEYVKISKKTYNLH